MVISEYCLVCVNSAAVNSLCVDLTSSSCLWLGQGRFWLCSHGGVLSPAGLMEDEGRLMALGCLSIHEV